MASRIEYKASVLKDLKQIEKKDAKRILDTLEDVLGKDPACDKPLHGPFKGMFTYAVGNYRVIYTTTKEGVLVLRIGHRGRVYKNR